MKARLEIEARHTGGPLQKNRDVARALAQFIPRGLGMFTVNGSSIYRVHTAHEVEDRAAKLTALEWRAVREAVASRCAGEIDGNSRDVAALRRAARKMGVADA